MLLPGMCKKKYFMGQLTQMNLAPVPQNLQVLQCDKIVNSHKYKKR